MNKGDSCGDILPKFFKVYLSVESTDDLELPVSYTSFLPNPLPKTVTVRSISGKVWKMALRKCCGEVERIVLINGWKRIAEDEDLQAGDFLEFEFDGSRLFDFCIYERETMCKRVRKTSAQREETIVESDSEEETQARDDTSLDDAAEDDETRYLDDPENPSFTVKLNPKKKSQLHIPAPVVKDYGLLFPDSITIIDPHAKKFGTLEKEIKTQMNDSVFVKGFGSIIRRNKVKTNDKMICEIKTMGDNNLVQAIKVHIIRG